MQAEKHRYALPEGANHSFDVDVSISVDARKCEKEQKPSYLGSIQRLQLKRPRSLRSLQNCFASVFLTYVQVKVHDVGRHV